MPLPTDSNGDAKRLFLPELQGRATWVFDMNDSQRKAHAEEMSANAEKLRAQAREINGRCGWSKFRLGVAYVGTYGLVFAVGLMVGVLFW